MELYVIRHAWAADRDDPRWPDDAQRPLTDAGCERFARMMAKLAKGGFQPEAVATSPLARCRQTADIVAATVSGRPRVSVVDALEPGSDLQALLTWTAEHAGDCAAVAWVGHAPDVSFLTAELIGERGAAIRFAKGTVAAIDFPGLPRRADGELRWLVTAKVLGV